MYHLILDRWLDLVLIKKNEEFVEFSVPVDHREKIKERKNKPIFRSCQRAEKAVERECQGNTTSCCCAWDGAWEPREGTGGIKSR